MEEQKLKRLKDNAAIQQRVQKKKREMLKKENIMKIYDISDYLSYLINNFNLLEKIYSNIEFRIADYK